MGGCSSTNSSGLQVLMNGRWENAEKIVFKLDDLNLEELKGDISKDIIEYQFKVGGRFVEAGEISEVKLHEATLWKEGWIFINDDEKYKITNIERPKYKTDVFKQHFGVTGLLGENGYFKETKHGDQITYLKDDGSTEEIILPNWNIRKITIEGWEVGTERFGLGKSQCSWADILKWHPHTHKQFQDSLEAKKGSGRIRTNRNPFVRKHFNPKFRTSEYKKQADATANFIVANRAKIEQEVGITIKENKLGEKRRERRRLQTLAPLDLNPEAPLDLQAVPRLGLEHESMNSLPIGLIGLGALAVGCLCYKAYRFYKSVGKAEEPTSDVEAPEENEIPFEA